MGKEQAAAPSVIKTGGQIDALVMALAETAGDKDGATRRAVKESLADIGMRKPALLLSSCQHFLSVHKKVPTPHRVTLLEAMCEVAIAQQKHLDESLVDGLIKLGVRELTASRERVEKWQDTACSFLIALGQRFSTKVIQALLEKCEPGSIPSYFVLQTLGEFASSHQFLIVPQLQDVFSRLLPVLAMIQQPAMKKVFATAMGHFCEAILNYVANIDQVENKSITVKDFSGQAFTIYEVMVSVWLKSNEIQTRLAIVAALGPICHVLDRHQFEGQLPTLLPTIMGLYNKHKEDVFPITQGVSMILEAAVADDSQALFPLLEPVLTSLQPFVFTRVDYSNPSSLKNHNELLRCFEIMSRVFSDRVVSFLIQRIEGAAANEKSRIGSLDIVKHLVNACDKVLDDKKELFLSGMKPLLESTNLKVNKAFAQVIIAMASKGYLNLDGGERMVEFIVQQCSLKVDVEKEAKKKEAGAKEKMSDPEDVSPSEMKKMCANVLHLVTTTIPCMEPVLWPYLTEFLIPAEFTDAIPIVCRCIGYLGAKKRSESASDYLVDYSTQVNVPKAVQVIARLLVMASQPLEDNRGEHVLRALLALGPVLDDDIAPMWDEVLPKMLKWLDDHSSSDDSVPFDNKAWEDLLLKFLSKLFDLKSSEEFTLLLGEEMARQFELYHARPIFKNFLFRCLGVAIKKSSNKNFIKTHLDLMFATVDHKDQTEREGCAIGAGFVASAHMDKVMEKLQHVAKNDMVRKASGFFGLVKDKTEADVERVKATLMLSYGYAALYAPTNMITSRLDVSILSVIVPHFASIRETVVKENAIKGVDLICEALLPRRLKDIKFVCNRRQELMEQMLTFIGQEGNKLKTNVQSYAMNACTTMVHLPPKLPEDDRDKLQTKCVAAVFNLPDAVDEERLEGTLKSLVDVLAATIYEDLSIAHLHSLVDAFLEYLRSDKEHTRVRAVQTLLAVLRKFFSYAAAEQGADDEHALVKGTYAGVGKLIALVVPRCSDPSLSIRQDAIDCVQTLLRIDLLVRGATVEVAENDAPVKALSVLRERAEKTEPTAQFAVVNDMSKVLAKKLAQDELPDFLYWLIDGLVDREANSGAGTCVMLNGLFKQRGKELEAEVPKLIETIHDKMDHLENEQTEIGTLRSIRTLSAHHLSKVVAQLLEMELPYDVVTVKMWHSLAADGNLAPPLIDHLLEIINRYQPYEEKSDGTRTATLSVRQATAAFAEIWVVEETEDLINRNYARVFGAALLRIGTANNVQIVKPVVDEKKKKARSKKGDAPSMPFAQPVDDALRLFRNAILRSQSDFLTEDLDAASEMGGPGWDELSHGGLYPDAIGLIARALCENNADEIQKLVEFLVPFLLVPYDSQRIVVCAFFAEVIQQGCCGSMEMMETLINSLLARLVDDSHVVRKLCIRGLGNVAAAPEKEVSKFSTTILSAMMAGMDDKNDIEDEITLESMNGLSRIMGKLGENNIRPILINICLRIRPCFEKDQGGVRAAAFTLFGRLAMFGNGPSKAPYLEQIHANLVSMLLHLNDAEETVRLACKQSLRAVGPLLSAPQVNDLFQKALKDERALAYGEFINDLSKCMIAEFPEKINFYVMGCVGFFRASWDTIRANASMFTGFMLGNLPIETRKVITSEHVCSALINLLKDPTPVVRTKVCETIGLLYEY